MGKPLKRTSIVAAALILVTAGYASAAGTLRIIRLNVGHSIRIGNVKVVAVGQTHVVTKKVTVTEPARTVTGPTVTGPTVTVTRTTTTTVAVPGPTVFVTVTTTPGPPPGPKSSFGDGTYRVNTDIVAGTYKGTGGSSCYWARLKGFSGSLDDILANGFGDTGPIVTILSSDSGFQTSNCGTWTKL